MPQPFSWTKLTNAGSVGVSPRAGHTITPTGRGFVLFGGMDGRRNDQGNPSPNNDVYIFKPGKKGTYEWSNVEIDPGSQAPPVRTLHVAVAITAEELFLHGGMHSTTPYQVLNDAWTLDTTCSEWKRMQFKTSTSEFKGSYLKRMSGRITEYIPQIHATQNGMPADASNSGMLGFSRRSIMGRSSMAAAGARRPSVNFESLAAAAGRASNAERGSSSLKRKQMVPSIKEEGSKDEGGRKTWKKIWNRKQGASGITAANKAQIAQMKLKSKAGITDRGAMMTSEEEQFHMDLLAMVTNAGAAAEDPTKTVGAPSIPAPRSNHSLALYENSLVLFGGYGGMGYQRRAFNDVWVLNIDNSRWCDLLCHGNPPAPRSGHASFEKDGCVFVFGGWNNETQFNDLFMLDVDNKDWSDLDLSWGSSRWNMASLLVEAIPSWRVFIFGGSTDGGEGRTIGVLDRTIGVLDLGEDRKWESPVPDDKGGKADKPCAREHTAMCYDPEDSRLFIYGGWANKWLDDCWLIDVSSIVGPRYAVVRVEPALGPVSGMQKIKVHGIGFLSTSGQVIVRFIAAGAKHTAEAQGMVVSDELVECHTPPVINTIGPRECEVRLAIGARDYTTTVASYHYYLNTVAEQSLCYGPGLLEEQQADHPTRFMIQARNQQGENRKSGRDEWVVQAQRKDTTVEGKEILKEVPVELVDFDNGQYEVRYKSEAGEVIIRVQLVENGKRTNIRGSPFKPTFITHAKNRANEYLGSLLNQWTTITLRSLEDFYRATDAGLSSKIKEGDVKSLIKVMGHIKDTSAQEADLVRKQDEVFEILAHIEREGMPIEKQLRALRRVGSNLASLKEVCQKTERSIEPLVKTESEIYRKRISEFETKLRAYHGTLKKEAYYHFDSGIELAFRRIDEVTADLDRFTSELEDLLHIAANFKYPDELAGSHKLMAVMREDIVNVRALWNIEVERITMTENFLTKRWGKVMPLDMEEEVKQMFKQLKEFNKVDKKLDVYTGMYEVIKRWTVFCPLVAELRDPAMRPRHWSMLMSLCGKNAQVTDDVLLRDMWNMELHKFPAEVEDIAERAKQEAKMEATISKLQRIWSGLAFEFEEHKSSPVWMMNLKEEDVETLEENQVQVQNMFASRFLAAFEQEAISWQKTLSSISEITTLLMEVERAWDFLENLFIHSEEVKKELPDESERFLEIDDAVKDLLKKGYEVKLVKYFCCDEPGIAKVLEKTQTQLAMCEKALHEFMDGKRRAFPRFYFMSAADLLDVLSNGNDPARVMPQFPKFFNAIDRYDLEYPEGPGTRPEATGMHARIGDEYVPFPEPLVLFGKVEVYLQRCIEAFRDALRHFIRQDLKDYMEQISEADGEARGKWLLGVKAAQGALLVQLITWVRLVENSLGTMDDGEGVRKAWEQQSALLLDLVELTKTDLSKPERQKVMCAITLDAHNRDVQERLVREQVASPEAFQWQSMLKGYWEVEQDAEGVETGGGDARMQICDAAMCYAYEYLGNGPRLVVTPLTDRIYVTATQALHLCMGCAPAGPAGTGKTESTKDLANALARACYVINAAPEMDYLTLGNIFKGLAASGSWGCFDEFNRLIPEVLSVCTVQFKAVCDALRGRSSRFILQGDEISLDDGVGAFITMNPGYLGRSELPEGLKALFRPITVMVPDFMLIMENMFMSEGFKDAKKLALKFSTLYALNKDLLSKSNKYDWGMRAIKSVLVVAGGFKRAEATLSEQAVLMRSLRDTNVAKIEGDDLKIFTGLLTDLFPGVEVPRARDHKFEEVLVDVMEKDFGYTNDPDGYFLLKITQLIELLSIRHSVFLMGSPGSFKSAMWRTLRNAKTRLGDKTTVVDFSPKAITTNELYGSVNMATREWKDGILSKTMRDLGQVPDTHPKWIMLDGDLDANWIESMNSVMDDSRLLTLPSNERIPLKQHMKMIFEIRDLNYATPATATRAGIVCMSDQAGIQWCSYVESWVRKVQYNDGVKDSLQKLFEKYCPETLNWVNANAKVKVPLADIAFISAFCSLLESLLTDHNLDALEYWFVFCVIWTLGSPLSEVDGVDYRKQFSNWWKNEMKTIKFASRGTVFDFFVKESRLEEWATIVESIEYCSTTPMGDVTVPTTETVAMGYVMKALLNINHPVMLIGLAGCGKTQLSMGLMKRLDPTTFMYHKMNMSYYTDSSLLQAMMEAPLEKKAGKMYAPPGKLQLIYFIDDLNMPALDKYNTQSGIELIKQKQDYSHWYDRDKITVKDICHTQYLCCMNPTAGSFVVNRRLQRHFWTCFVSFPEQSALLTIYSTFVKGHFEKLPFKMQVQETASGVIKAALSLHLQVSQNFRKTAKNMHYEFNIRHLSGVFAGLLQAKPSEFTDAEKFALLWIHESERIYGDRLVSNADLRKYRNLSGEMSKKMFPKFAHFQRYFQERNPEPLVFAPFSQGVRDMVDGGCYDKIKDMDRLSAILNEAMREYDSSNASMDLVLFEDAMKHVAKICRIMSNPSGHPLLVGVGGSGRQSLARLSAFICHCMTFAIVISGSYGINDLKADLQTMCKRAGAKDEGVMFLITDNQIANERFLVYLNDLLSSGEVTDLFPTEDKDMIRNQVRTAAKSAGVVDTPDNLWNFFITEVRKNLHVSMCFSPVGDLMWSRARKFPALVNCTAIDWFQQWPMGALLNVAAKFLAPVEQLGLADSAIRAPITDFFPFTYEAINELSRSFYDTERRYAYSTPKSFLESLKLYTTMLEEKADLLADKKQRLSIGLVKLRTTQDQVAGLEEELKEKAIVVQEKATKADAFAEEVGREKAKVNAEAEKASIEAVKCQQIAIQVSEKKTECTRELEAAVPLVAQAEAALDVLDKKDLNELKAFTRPPPGVDTVCEAALVLQATVDPLIDVNNRGRLKDRTWKSSAKMMGDPFRFLLNLKAFKGHIDDGSVPAYNFEEARKLIEDMGADFSPESIRKKSQAAAGLSEWVINIIKYYDVVVQVEPKKKSLRDATETLKKAEERQAQASALVRELEDTLKSLVAEHEKAIAEKEGVMAEAERCQTKLQMAQRLVNALSANGEIWQQTVEKTAEELVFIPGDSVVACAFASYVGIFTREYREAATERFVSFLLERQVPLSERPDPLATLSTEAEQARWCAKGLPRDRASLENGSIMMCSKRWSLIIDPQTQGSAWIKQKEAERNLQATRMGQGKIIQVFEAAISAGTSVLVENMGESIDAVLMPVVARNTIKRGKQRCFKLGDKEIVCNPGFKLFLQTKLSNPHYPPEVQAECTVINFTVTEQGLEDQLLFLVMRLERPDLARTKSDLIQQQNEFKVRLADLEALLLEKLSSAEGDILDDVDLIMGLEDAKETSDEVQGKVIIAAENEAKINEISENYRPTATRGALLFFLMMSLGKMHTFYKYSLDAFVMVATRAINSVTLRKPKEIKRKATITFEPDPAEAEKPAVDADRDRERNDEDDENGEEGAQDDLDGQESEEEVEEVVGLSGKELAQRVQLLEEIVTLFAFSYIRRGLLDKDKLTVASMLALRVLVRSGAVQPEELLLLIRAPPDPSAPPIPESTRAWLSEGQWSQLKSLEQVAVFKSSTGALTQNLEQDSLGWKRWFAEERAEVADLPRGCRDISMFHRLFLLRVLRPDRIGAALTQFVTDNLGGEFIEQPPFDMAQTYEESSHMTPIFFVLFPGTDPTPTVEAFAKTLNITEANGRFSNISMGQGQEQVAINLLNKAARDGSWVMLQNIHLVQAWLKTLERALEYLDEVADPQFRCMLTSEPPSLLQGALWELLPEAVLQRCVKIADEAPTDLRSNLRRAYAKFNQYTIEDCLKPREFKATLFALCFFHSLVLGRIKFGPQGWSKKYPFNDGDLTICAKVLCNYLNNAEKLGNEVPWPDLRYIFGEIMYGGHITDLWDRRVCNTYLANLVQPELLTNLTMAPGFKSPDASKMDYSNYQKVIEEKFPGEAPGLFGLHSNAEIGFLTNQGMSIFKTVQSVSGSDAGAQSLDLAASEPLIASYLEQLPPCIDTVELRAKLRDEEYTPYIITSFQESERMNGLLQEIRQSLSELELGIGGQLNVSDSMEHLSEALQLNRVNSTWAALAYPSLKPLGMWFADLLLRTAQLVKWTSRLALLKSIWLSGLFNPMSFLTAVMQVTARSRELPLDYMTNRTTFLNTRDPEELAGLPSSGVHVHGLFMEGASWEDGKGDDEGYIADSKMKELHPEMPIANIYSVKVDQMSWTNMYHCPVFITAERGATFIMQVNLRMDPDDEDERHWVLAGAALLMTDD